MARVDSRSTHVVVVTTTSDGTEAPAGFSIGSVPVAGRAVQAALSGYSDLAMRRVARRFGAPYAIHEVVVDRVLVDAGGLGKIVGPVPDDDHPVGGQIMGAEPEVFAQAARYLVDAGFDVIDLNFGCPVKKVLGRRRGGFLLGEPDTALQLVDAVLDVVDGRRPVSVKMRRGIDDTAASERNFWTVIEGAFDRGIDAVTIHPRTVEQRYVGPSDWSFLAEVRKRLPDRVLLGSGDLFGPEDVVRMLEETGVDGVTLARGAIGNPFLFRQVEDRLAGRPVLAPTLGEQRTAIELHWDETVAALGPKRGPGRARTHTIKYAGLHPDGAVVRAAFAAARNERDFRAAVAVHYPPERDSERAADPQALAQRAQQLKKGASDCSAI